MSAQAALLLALALIGDPPPATPPTAPPLVPAVTPAVRACCCSGQCSCGCNAGIPCDTSVCREISAAGAGETSWPSFRAVQAPASGVIPPLTLPPPHPYTVFPVPGPARAPAFRPAPQPSGC